MELIRPTIDRFIDAVREQEPFKNLGRTNRRFKISRLADSLRVSNLTLFFLEILSQYAMFLPC